MKDKIEKKYQFKFFIKVNPTKNDKIQLRMTNKKNRDNPSEKLYRKQTNKNNIAQYPI